ncbi:MAG: hypothetical protein J6J17_04170 [Bacilli bacterium]|nr:hypothetical protein [Bacilli bacterium]
MINHKHTEETEINFSKIEERLLQINDPNLFTNFEFGRKARYLFRDVPTLIVATGGSKAAAHYLKMFLESIETLCEVIEPRDYFHKRNINQFKNLIVLSSSGKSNGLLEILRNFHGSSYLITSEYVRQEDDYTHTAGYFKNESTPLFDILYWSNGKYKNREKSFISIIPTLAPMLMFLELSILKETKKGELSSEDLMKINGKLKQLLEKSKNRINNLNFNFKDTNLIQIMSGYDTTCSSSILESNMIETGTSSVVVHDKGSYCHGRSNLLFQNPGSPIIYLAHQMKDLDNELLPVLTQEYPNIFLFHTLDEDVSIFWKEYYLAIQMYFLSKKIAEDKGIDLTMPEYNPQVVKKLYRYKGEM